MRDDKIIIINIYMVDIAIIISLVSAIGALLNCLYTCNVNKNKNITVLLHSACDVIFEKNYMRIYREASLGFLSNVLMDELIKEIREYMKVRDCGVKCYSNNKLETRIKDRINYLVELKIKHARQYGN